MYLNINLFFISFSNKDHLTTPHSLYFSSYHYLPFSFTSSFFFLQVSILPTPHTVFFIFNIYHYLVHLTTSLYPSHHPCLVHLISHSLSFTLPLSRPPASSHSLSRYHFLVHLKPVVSRPPLTMPRPPEIIIKLLEGLLHLFQEVLWEKVTVSMGGFLNLGVIFQYFRAVNGENTHDNPT